jgi:hypothetical protein
MDENLNQDSAEYLGVPKSNRRDPDFLSRKL